MSSVAVKTILKQIAALPVPEQQRIHSALSQKLGRPEATDHPSFLATSESNGQGLPPGKAIAAGNQPAPKVRLSTRKRVDLSKEREWVRQHRDEYRGQWVVLDGDRLLGHTADADEATALFKQARCEGVRAPYAKLIPADDEPISLMCL